MEKTNVVSDARYWKSGVSALRKNDNVLARIMPSDFYKELKLDSDYYGSLVESIVFQQLAGKAAEAILKRFKALYKGRIPTPKEFLKTSEEKIRASGISPQKYSYLKDLSIRLHEGLLSLEGFDKMSDEKVIEELSSVKGIGRWTAEMFLIFSLGRPDVMPMDDLGVRKGIQKAYGLKELPDKKRILKMSKKWHPYCSIVTLFMWNYLDTKTVGDVNG
ncbi:MAG: DNA-3-methyladenine glycosylase [Candidatus Marsarchaeota archaeon]|nr:DNA-3-methyladenine glycosylase [Candidatus Marsarchaeota archaeon]